MGNWINKKGDKVYDTEGERRVGFVEPVEIHVANWTK